MYCAYKDELTPSCDLQILGEPKENRKLAAELTLQNPLPEQLENCCFTIEGANLTGGSSISERYEELYNHLRHTQHGAIR